MLVIRLSATPAPCAAFVVPVETAPRVDAPSDDAMDTPPSVNKPPMRAAGCDARVEPSAESACDPRETTNPDTSSASVALEASEALLSCVAGALSRRRADDAFWSLTT